jgi:hypothetical protein
MPPRKAHRSSRTSSPIRLRRCFVEKTQCTRSEIYVCDTERLGRPYGTRSHPHSLPGVETPGYSHASSGRFPLPNLEMRLPHSSRCSKRGHDSAEIKRRYPHRSAEVSEYKISAVIPNEMSAQARSQSRIDPAKVAAARERLRRRYRPPRVRMLFVGESPPASGRFFYQADSGLYRAIRQTFLSAFPTLKHADFLESFRQMDCYLVDLCGNPVDHLPSKPRRLACERSETRLAAKIRQLNPEVIVTVVRSIAANVQRAQARANWQGTHLVVSYPGRWKTHRVAFEQALKPVLRRTLREDRPRGKSRYVPRFPKLVRNKNGLKD